MFNPDDDDYRERNLCPMRALIFEREIQEVDHKLEALSHRDDRMKPALLDENLRWQFIQTIDGFVAMAMEREFDMLHDSKALTKTHKKGKVPSFEKVAKEPQPAHGPPTDPTANEYGPSKAYRHYFQYYIYEYEGEMFRHRNPMTNHAITTMTRHFIDNIDLACERIGDDWDYIQNGFFRDNTTVKQLIKIRTTGSDYHKGGKQVLILTFSYEVNPAPQQQVPMTVELVDGSTETVMVDPPPPPEPTVEEIWTAFQQRGLGQGGNQHNALQQLAVPTRRVVYKPTDIEVDARFLGDSQVINQVLANSTKPGPFNIAGGSMVERFNTALNQAGPAALATYVILPFNPGSQLGGGPALRIRDSYGYLEFLTHEPADLNADPQNTAATGAELTQLSQAEVQASGGPLNFDWVSTDPQSGQRFWRQWGELLALAHVFSLCDLHFENAIVHACQPHLIDIEEALKKPFGTLRGSYLIGSLDRGHAAQNSFMAVISDSTAAMIVMPVRPEDAEHSTLRLYIYDTPVGAQNPVARHASMADYLEFVVGGFVDAMRAVRGHALNTQIRNWLATAPVSNSVARLVPIATSALYQRLILTYSKAYCRNRVPRTAQDFEAFSHCTPDRITRHPYLFAARAFDVGMVQGNYEGAWTAEISKQQTDADRSWVTPHFVLESPDHVWYDYMSLDVPAFYHRLGSRDLMNSRGQVVDVAGVCAYLRQVSLQFDNPERQNYIHNVLDRQGTGRGQPPSQFQHYFPDTAINAISGQIHAYETMTNQAFETHLGECIDEIITRANVVNQGGRAGFEGRVRNAYPFYAQHNPPPPPPPPPLPPPPVVVAPGGQQAAPVGQDE